MIPLIVAVSLLVTVLIAGVAAGPLVRGAAPVLMRTPRLAVGVLGGVLIVWLIGFAAFGPMLAWALGTPTGLLPGATGEVCQRCLDAVNPLPPGMGFSAGIPAALLLSLPLLVGGIMLAGGLRYRRQQQRDRKSTRLNSSHVAISYAVFCFKKKKNYVERAALLIAPSSTSTRIAYTVRPPTYTSAAASATTSYTSRIPALIRWALSEPLPTL